MANGRTSKNEHEFRVNKVANLLSVGTVRSEISQFATTEWGVSQRSIDRYIQEATAILKQDFDSFNNDRILAARKRVIDLLYLIGSWEEQRKSTKTSD